MPLRTLLYVEDNPDNLMLVEDLIARRPDIRSDQRERRHQRSRGCACLAPDVILMDINLPGISGVEALRILEAVPVDPTFRSLRSAPMQDRATLPEAWTRDSSAT